MASDDYSRRSSKEIDFGDSNITEQELTTRQDSVPEPPTTPTVEQSEVDSIVQKYKSDIQNLKSAKTVSILSLLLLGPSILVASAARGSAPQYMACSLFTAAIGVFGLIYSGTARKETDIINSIKDDFKIIEWAPQMKLLPIYKRIFCFNQRPVESCEYNSTSKTAVTIDGSVVYSANLNVYFVTRHGRNSQLHNVLDCEYHDYIMPAPYANGVLVCKGPMLVIKHPLYEDGKYRFYYFNDEKTDSDLDRITRLMDRLSEKLPEQNFALFYDSGMLHLIVTDPNAKKGGIFENTKESINTKAQLFARRIKIAKILSEQN